MQDTILYLVPALAVFGLISMFVQSRWVRSQSTGEEKMSTIAKHIHEGALAFLSAEYRILAVFVVVAGALLGVVSMLVPTTHWFIVIAFVIGAVFSALAGNIGMRIATEANVRTTQAARTARPRLKVPSPAAWSWASASPVCRLRLECPVHLPPQLLRRWRLGGRGEHDRDPRSARRLLPRSRIHRAVRPCGWWHLHQGRRRRCRPRRHGGRHPRG